MGIFGCSGPGAGEAIARNIAYGDEQASVVALLFGLSLILRWMAGSRWYFPLGCGLLLLLHPAWTVSAIKGDCGHFKSEAATVFTWLAGLAVVSQAIIALYADRRGNNLPEA